MSTLSIINNPVSHLFFTNLFAGYRYYPAVDLAGKEYKNLGAIALSDLFAECDADSWCGAFSTNGRLWRSVPGISSWTAAPRGGLYVKRRSSLFGPVQVDGTEEGAIITADQPVRSIQVRRRVPMRVLACGRTWSWHTVYILCC